MANEQAWEDFKVLTEALEYLEGMIGEGLNAVFTKLEGDYNEILADEPRLLAAAQIADAHYKWTSAAIVEAATKYLSLRDYLIAQGFIS